MAADSNNHDCGSVTQFDPDGYGMETLPSAVAIVNLVYQVHKPHERR
jgi:hypothetical protein|tara:strand:- start:813 stop:953 length:141 start_codon:yes stop_codon:yes gene_type:complete